MLPAARRCASPHFGLNVSEIHRLGQVLFGIFVGSGTPAMEDLRFPDVLQTFPTGTTPYAVCPLKGFTQPSRSPSPSRPSPSISRRTRTRCGLWGWCTHSSRCCTARSSTRTRAPSSTFLSRSSSSCRRLERLNWCSP